MDLKNFFNILLLGISLTTILVTLVSYIVFKLRLGAGKKHKAKDPLDGSFYRRFAPIIKSEYLKTIENQNLEKGRGVSIKVKFVSLFVFLVVIISGLLLFEDYFSYRKEISERVLAANNFRELVKKGHLKSYEYIPKDEDSKVRLKFSKNAFDQTTYLLDELKEQQFCLVSTYRASKFSGVKHKLSVQKWINFFKRYKLNYILSKTVNTSSKCLPIYPHIHSFSRSQVSTISKQERPFLAIGGFGVIDGLGSSVSETLLAKYISKKVGKEIKNHPSLISSEKGYLWEIDGGSFVDWKPIDTNFAHVLSSEGSIISSDYNGKILRENDKVLSRIIKNGNATWTSLDPIDHPYSDLVILNIFANMIKLPVFKIQNFKMNKEAVSFIYRQSKQVDDLEEIKETFKELDSPWTLFTNDYNYQGVSLSDHDKKIYDTAILTSSEHKFDKLDNRSAFNLLENIRLKLEELSYSGVTGLTSYNNFFNEVLLDSSNQNKLSYLYGTSQIISYSPVFLGGQSYFLIPKMFKNSQELLDDKSITNVEDLLSKFNTRLSDARLVGGLSIFDISSNEMSDHMYKNAITKIADDYSSKSISLRQLVEWRNQKERLRVSSKVSNGSLKIIIANTNTTSVKNFNIMYDGLKGREEFSVASIGPKETLTIDPVDYRER